MIWGEAALLFWIDNFVHSASGGREIKYSENVFINMSFAFQNFCFLYYKTLWICLYVLSYE